MGTIEEVQKILDDNLLIEGADYTDVDKAAKQICQLFEPKPDESRLLTDEEIDALDAEFTSDQLGSHAHENKLVATQDAKTAPIEYKRGYDDACKVKDAECQARVERIFREIEKILFVEYGTIGGLKALWFKESLEFQPIELYNLWQALKKQEGIE